jgi:putative colanic acid biosynthesis UDP-glucose lipid carrier transferase
MSTCFSYRSVLKEQSTLFRAVIQLSDWLVIGCTGWLAHWAYLGTSEISDAYKAALMVGILLSSLVFSKLNVYRAWRGVSMLEEFRLLAVAWSIVVLSMIVLAFLAKMGASYSRVWGALWAVSACMGLVASRILLRYLLRRLRARGLNLRQIVLVGAGDLGREVARRITSTHWSGFDVKGFFFDDSHVIRQGTLDGVPVLGGLGELPLYLKRHPVAQVWLTLPLKQEDQIREVLQSLQEATVDIRVVLDPFGLRLMNHSLIDIAGLPVVNLSVSPMDGINRVAKALEDRVLAFIILMLVSPLLLLIAIGIKLDSPGPVLFRQKRHGWGCQPMEIWKFRTMYIHDEPARFQQATRQDPRVTRIGNLLRRTSLDELPQFINVLQGHMSIVGPRPHPIVMNSMYENQVNGYMRRHKVKPGITGWAQVNGYRGETDTLEKIEMRVQYDLYYIENWSLWFDFKIMIWTLTKGFANENAY